MNKTYTLDLNCLIDACTLNHDANVQNKSESDSSILKSLRKFALSVPDFRRSDKGNLRHRLADIITLIIFARASKCASRVDIIEFGKNNISQFHKLGMLRNGVPSEATLCCVGNGIDATEMADKMQEFVREFHDRLLKPDTDKEVICIDGKAVRGTVQANGRNPDIVSAFSYDTGLTLATEMCKEKSNEIKAVPLLLDKIDVKGKIVTADAMSLQKSIIDKIRAAGGDYLIELKANQRSLRYLVEDRRKEMACVYSYSVGPEAGHGRIETRTYRIYDGLSVLADASKWGGNLTIIEYISDTVEKSTKAHTTETRYYVSSLPADTPCLGTYIRNHWSIESMHWMLDRNLRQDSIKRKTSRAARNLDTIHRIVHSIFSIWKGLRKKRSDKRKGMSELMRLVSKSFTKLIQFLSQK